MKGALTAEEALRYAMSLPVTTTITGMDKLEVVRQNLKVAQGFKPMEAAEMRSLRDRCREFSDPDRIFAANGAIKALQLAKQQGKVRFVTPAIRILPSTSRCSLISFRLTRCSCRSTASMQHSKVLKRRCCRT